MTRKDWNDQDERPTNRGGKRGGPPRSDTDFNLGQLMVESINHKQRIEVLEERIEVLEATAKNNSLAPGISYPPNSRQRLFAIVRKTVTTTAIIIAALISALKELGFLGVH